MAAQRDSVDGEITVCADPECDSPRIYRREPEKESRPTESDERYRCMACGETFDRPRRRASQSPASERSSEATQILIDADPEEWP